MITIPDLQSRWGGFFSQNTLLSLLCVNFEESWCYRKSYDEVLKMGRKTLFKRVSTQCGGFAVGKKDQAHSKCKKDKCKFSAKEQGGVSDRQLLEGEPSEVS